MHNKTRQRWKLILLAALFFGPFISAWVVYFGPDSWKPGGNTAHGRLITPAKPLPAVSFASADGEPTPLRDRWTLLHLGQGDCGAACREQLWQTRQLRTLLHRRRSRVQRAYLADSAQQAQSLRAELQAEHPQLLWLSLDPVQREALTQWLGSVPEQQPILVIDPLGNALMVYGDELPLKGMLSDLKRLLKLSNIG